MKHKPIRLQAKLWLYFILFTALIFSVLWLLQTVFLQRFYNRMLIADTKAAAAEIIENAGSVDIDALIDSVAREHSVLVYVTDQNGAMLYSADEYKGAHKNKDVGGKNGKGRGKNEQTGGQDAYRSLPDGYGAFLEALSASDNGTAEIEEEHLYVYGAYIPYAGVSDAVLYVGATLDAVGSAVSIIRLQLAIGTVFSLIVGFALAWFLARRFAQPVARLAEKAGRLGEKGYDADFTKGFSEELDDLSDTLDETHGKLVHAREYQNELLANVSHDLRTPLTMIKGYAEEVNDFSWQNSEQREHDLNVIIRESDRLTAMVNEILEYSELQAENKTDDFVRFDLSASVNRVADGFEFLFRREGGVIERQIEENITVYGSLGKLERAVYNLLDNAMRHAGEEKEVTVTLTEENGFAVLSVADRGEGIEPEQLDRIWDRYYTNRQRDGKGVSGLGLAIVKQTVTLHGGVCEVQSTPGEGSRFMIRIPTV